MQTIRYDATNLFPEATGLRFNPSIIESSGGYLIAWRDAWRFSRLWAGRLDSHFQPIGTARKLNTPEGGITKCVEDPRWFRVAGKLHLACATFSGRTNHVCYAPINEATLKVESFHWPQNLAFRSHEKNHSMFDYGGQIHAVYSTSPTHRILRYTDGEPGYDPVATFIHETHFSSEWSGGPIRGGCSPVLHNGEWWHWMHGYTMQSNGRRLYTMGVVCFENAPPFRVTRYTPEPIAVADPSVEPKAEKSDVIFPCGAVVYGDSWAVSMGINDTFSEIRFYPMADVEKAMVKHGD